jgi:hypothetical protein
MNGITSMCPIITTKVSANAFKCRAFEKSRHRSGSTCASGTRCFCRCSVSDGTMRRPPSQITHDSATSSTNGEDQPKCAPSITPAGTPAIAASENAVMIVPVAAPRRETGITSPTMAITTDASTPPVMPANARAASSRGKFVASAQPRFDSANSA